MIQSDSGRALLLMLLAAAAANTMATPAAAQTSDTGAPDVLTEPGDESRSPRKPKTETKKNDRLRFEVGVTPRYISNYFQLQDDFNNAVTPIEKESVYLATLTGAVEYDLMKREDSSLTAGARVRRNLFKDLEGADSTELDATLSYRFRPHEVRLGLFRTPRRLVSNSGGRNVYSETNGFSAEYLTRPTRRLRARAEYQYARETFSEFDERDVSRHLFRGDVRYQIDPLFTPGIGLEYLRGNGRSDNFSYTRPALVLLANSRISDIAYLTFRYRLSRREFTTDNAMDSNFDRVDRRRDLTFYGTAQLGGGFELFGFASHTDSNSNRDTRDFTGYETGLGLFYNF